MVKHQSERSLRILQSADLRAVQRATPKQILTEARLLIEQSNAVVREVMRSTDPTWETVIQPLEEIFERQQRGCGRVGALQSVQSTPARQQLVEAIDRLVNTQTTWYGRQRKLYLVILKLRQSKVFATYTTAEQRTIELYLRNFRLLGIDLPPAKQLRLGVLRKKMDHYAAHFSRNILSATQRSVVLVTDPARIEGIPESVLRSAKARAKRLKKSGHLTFPLD
jgi:oligopeptidase A